MYCICYSVRDFRFISLVRKASAKNDSGRTSIPARPRIVITAILKENMEPEVVALKDGRGLCLEPGNEKQFVEFIADPDFPENGLVRLLMLAREVAPENRAAALWLKRCVATAAHCILIDECSGRA